MDPRLCPADLFPLQKPLSVGPRSHPASHACMTRTSRDSPERGGVPPGIPALCVAQPCSYAGKQERAESFFSISPPVPRMRLLPHTFGGSELAKVGVVVHAPHEVLPARRRRRRRREWPTSLSLASRPVAGPPVLPGTDSLSCTQRTQRTQRHVTQCATSLMRIWTKKVSESEKWIWLDCWSSGERSGWGRGESWTRTAAQAVMTRDGCGMLVSPGGVVSAAAVWLVPMSMSRQTARSRPPGL